MKAQVGFFFLIPVALFVLGMFVLAFSQAEPSRPAALNPLVKYAPCRQITAGPSRLYACSDRRAWIQQNGRWQDAGPLSPLPKIPSN